MIVEEAFVAALKANRDIKALVADRVFPAGTVSRRAMRPYVTHQEVTSINPASLAGQVGLVQAWLQVDVIDDDKARANGVRTAIQTFLRAANTARLLGTMPVRSIRYEGNRSMSEPVGEGSDTTLFRVGFDLRIWAEE